MEKYLEQIRLFTFELLIDSIFKISKNFKLIKFERIEQNGLIDYKFTIRTNKTEQSDLDVVGDITKYLKDVAIKK